MSRTRAALALGASAAVGALLLGAVPSSQAAPVVSAHLQRALQGPDSGDFPGAEVPVGDADRRGPRLPKLASSEAAVAALGNGIRVSSYTQYGTPLSLMREKSFLATGLHGSPVQIARDYLRDHAAVWGLSAADVDDLQVVLTAPLSQSTTAYSVSFNQKVDGLLVAQDGYVVVGVVRDSRGGRVAGVTSSLVPAQLLSGLSSTSPRISVSQAVLAAAKDAGITTLRASDLTVKDKPVSGFRIVAAKGLHQVQRARLRCCPPPIAGLGSRGRPTSRTYTAAGLSRRSASWTPRPAESCSGTTRSTRWLPAPSRSPRCGRWPPPAPRQGCSRGPTRRAPALPRRC
ncbi:MAG: hypothetical protein ABR549_16115 [Mycobacteriales bacterium]